MAEKRINFTINEGTSFFAEEIAVMHNPVKFIIDFKSITPRFDMRNREMQPMVLTHNVVQIDPYVAKDFLKVLKNVVTQYEKQFGTIKKPKGVEQKKVKVEKSETPNYFG